MASLGLYLHIPFCKKMCPYCAFYKIHWNEELETPFVNAVLKELLYYSNKTTDFSIHSIFFGGGTPTLLSQKSWTLIFSFIKTHFKLTTHCEITTEANPETLTPETLSFLNTVGFNRLSVGIQSMHQKELTYLGREHTPEHLQKTLKNISKYGPKNINFDLIFGTQAGTLPSLMNSLKQLLQFSPTHISTYSLSIEPGTPFDKKNISPIPNDKELDHYKSIITFLNTHGYEHYEVSAFAKQGFQCLHNLTYWTYQEFIGIGPSATSFIKGKRYTRSADLNDYIKNPLPSKLIENTTTLCDSEQIQEYIISMLRLKQGLSLDHFEKTFNCSFMKRFHQPMKKLLADDFLIIKNNLVSTTEKGLYLLNEILLEFLN
jgi:oxygen-independent coproporphyrinogen III oxidase